jgi:hypothetical protein
MEFLTKSLIILFGLIVSVATTILVMIKGWGLHPQSWFWIIVVNIFMQLFAQLIIAIGSHKTKKD